MKRNYDLIVPVYDWLVKIIYGKALRNAQTLYLPFIPAFSSILVAGGGTGWILEEITHIHPQDLHIDYIDISAKMIAEARKKFVAENEVRFINQSIFHWQPDAAYDVIITPFFFDNLSEKNTQKAFIFLHSKLKTNGLWFYTDFQISQNKAWWQKALLFIMYAFFRLAANIEATKLPNVASQFHSHNYIPVKTTTFFHQFIITTVYKNKLPVSDH